MLFYSLCLFSVHQYTSFSISIFKNKKTKHLHLEVHQRLFSVSCWFQPSNLQWQKRWRELQRNKVLGRENSLSHPSLWASLPFCCLSPPNCCTPFSAIPTESCVSNSAAARAAAAATALSSPVAVILSSPENLSSRPTEKENKDLVVLPTQKCL